MLSPVENEGVIAARPFQTHADNIKINHQLRAYRESARLSGPPGELQMAFSTMVSPIRLHDW